MDEASTLARAEVELENLLGVPHRSSHAGGPQRPDSSRLGRLAAEAHRRELLSEGQLARLLRLDRVTLRMMLDDADMENATDVR